MPTNATVAESIAKLLQINQFENFFDKIISHLYYAPSLLRWGYSSVGRAPALQAGGQRFEPAYLHHLKSGLQAIFKKLNYLSLPHCCRI